MIINGNATVHSAYFNKDMISCPGSYVFDPACEMNVSHNSMIGTLVEGAAWGDHKINYS
jgi:hypothetical protein